MTEFEKQLHSMFDHIWECEIDHPVFQDTVGELMSAVIQCYNNLPSAQPKPCEDAVSREAISEWLKQYGQDVLHGKYKFSLMYIWKNLMDLPSAQPEIVRCKECKHHWIHRCMDSMPTEICDLSQTFYDPNVDFCSLAERRTDE